MNPNELTAIFEKYCKKLRITPAWDVELRLIDDPEWTKTGDFKIDCTDRKAILLLNSANPKNESMEEVILHERVLISDCKSEISTVHNENVPS